MDSHFSKCRKGNNAGRKKELLMLRKILVLCPLSFHHPVLRSFFPPLLSSELPGFVLETPDTVLVHAWNIHVHREQLIYCRAGECAFPEFRSHLFLGVPWKHTFCHLIWRPRQRIFSCQQLCFLTAAEKFPTPGKSPSWPSPVTMRLLSRAGKERGAPAEWFMGMDS